MVLLSDAGHNLADALALIFSWYALRLAGKPADARRTYGSHRAGILAALVNAAALVVIALFIFWEAVERLRSPEPVQGGLMIGVALAAVLLNGVIALWLHHEARHDRGPRKGARAHQGVCRAAPAAAARSGRQRGSSSVFESSSVTTTSKF